MECEDSKGTLDFLNSFDDNQKSFANFKSLMKSIPSDKLSKELGINDIFFFKNNIYINCNKSKDEVINAINSIIDLKDDYTMNRDTFNLLLQNSIFKTSSGFIIYF